MLTEQKPTFWALEEFQRRVAQAGREGDAFRAAFGYNVPLKKRTGAFRILIEAGYNIYPAAVFKQGLQPTDVGLKSKK